jgi:predicted dehydrogenase
MQPLRVAVVGGGFGQQVLIPAFRRDPRSTVELVCASTEARAREISETAGVTRATGDWRAVVTDSQIDIVAISVPPVLQAEVAIAAANAGKHVFAEKPLAMTTTEGRAMIAAAATSGVVGGIDFELRETPAWQRARELLRQGAIGRIRHVYIDWRVETWAHRNPAPSWKRDAAAGGGTLNLFASHSIDSVVWLFGPISRVAARLGAFAPGDAESRVDAWFELADGTPVSLAIAADATAANEHRIAVYGDDAALILENLTRDYASGFTLTVTRRGSAPTAIELPPPEPGDGRVVAVGALVRRFLDAILDRRSLAPSFDDGIVTQQVIDAVRAADRTGTWQSPS